MSVYESMNLYLHLYVYILHKVHLNNNICYNVKMPPIGKKITYCHSKKNSLMCYIKM